MVIYSYHRLIKFSNEKSRIFVDETNNYKHNESNY